MVGGQSPDKFMTTSGGGESTWVTSLALLLSIVGHSNIAMPVLRFQAQIQFQTSVMLKQVCA